MNSVLRKISIGIGLFLLYLSMSWSKDGFRFDLAGDAADADWVALAGWGLALSCSVIQFVFSTNYRELNPSLIFFGVMAYIYSIYTNYHGVLGFQGSQPNTFGAGALAFVIDGIPEPLIAWGLGESLVGDFIGNLIKAVMGDNSPKKSSQNQGVFQGNQGDRGNQPRVKPHFTVNQQGKSKSKDGISNFPFYRGDDKTKPRN